MLESVVIEGFADAGELAETLLFYPKATVVVDEKSLRSLGRKSSVADWVDFFHAHRETIRPLVLYSDIYPSGLDPYWRSKTYKGRLIENARVDDESWHHLMVNSGMLPDPNTAEDWGIGLWSRQPALAERFSELCEARPHSLQLYQPLILDGDELHDALGQYLDSDDVRRSLPKHVGRLGPIRFTAQGFTCEPYQDNFEVSFSERYALRTAIALSMAVQAFMATVAALPAYHEFGADLASGVRPMAALAVLLRRAITRLTDVPSELQIFREVILYGVDIRGWVNAQDNPVRALRYVYEAVGDFRKWASKAATDESTLEAYYREVMERTRVRSLPARIARWGMFTGPGVALDFSGFGHLASFTGLGLSAIDAFLLDKLSRGWSPNYVIRDLNRAMA